MALWHSGSFAADLQPSRPTGHAKFMHLTCVYTQPYNCDFVGVYTHKVGMNEMQCMHFDGTWAYWEVNWLMPTQTCMNMTCFYKVLLFEA